jgi:hypothetical protein
MSMIWIFTRVKSLLTTYSKQTHSTIEHFTIEITNSKSNGDIMASRGPIFMSGKFNDIVGTVLKFC